MLTRRPSTHRALAALVAASALAALGPAGSAQAAPSPCAKGNTKISKLSSASVRGAMSCLANRARRANGVPRLTYVPTREFMGRSAMAHARNGAATRSWTDWQHSHMEPGAPGDFNQQITDRIRATGYCPTGAWSTAEITFNGTSTTPADAINWWMSDPPHRATLLNPALKGAGYGIARGLGDPKFAVGRDSGVFVMDFGSCNGAAASR